MKSVAKEKKMRKLNFLDWLKYTVGFAILSLALAHPLTAADVPHLDIQAPSQITAGESFEIKIQALDKDNNTVAEDRKVNLTIYEETTKSDRTISLNEGIGKINLVFEKTGSVLLFFEDAANYLVRSSNPILVTPKFKGVQK